MLLAAAAIALALSGCATVTTPRAGLTAAQLDDYYQLRADLDWRRTGLPDELRPPPPTVHVVNGDQWATVLADCMNSAGYDNYSDEGGGFGSFYVERTAEEEQVEVATLFGCRSAVRLEGQDDFLFNPAQVDYLYEYFQDVLVPCLAVNEVEVMEVPTRAEFVESNAGWNPYFSVAKRSWPILADGDVLLDCPDMPPGMPGLGLTSDSFE